MHELGLCPEWQTHKHILQ